MSIAILLIPDFALILFGFILNHITGWGRDFWAGLEKLIYYVLFPALLFNSIARTRIDFAAAAPEVNRGAAPPAVVERCHRRRNIVASRPAFQSMKQHYQRLCTGCLPILGGPVEIDKVAVGRIPAFAAICHVRTRRHQ